MSDVLFSAKRSLAVAAGIFSRRAGRGGGTSLPGKLLLKMQPDAIGRMSAQLSEGSIVISATNGKTTTATMLAAILDAAGVAHVHNSAGANMASGIATALLDPVEDTSTGMLGLFEVDEAWLGRVAEDLQPRVVVLGNLFRDQLDRYGELELIAESWRRSIGQLPDSTRVVLNADDPLVAEIAGDRQQTLFFGVDDSSLATTGLAHATDSKHCRNCGAPLTYDVVLLGHMGHYRCESCGNRRPRPQISATAVELHGMSGSSVSLSAGGSQINLDLPLPGLYNVYNALTAAAAATALDLPLTAIKSGLEAAVSAFGRVETVCIGGHDVAILLVKNPAGANEVLRTLALENRKFDLWFALNDGIADGKDISWVWDADFELIAPLIHKLTCSGTRAEEMALRMKYAGVPVDDIVCDRELERSFDTAVASAGSDDVPVYALPTYTALLQLRSLIARRGLAKEFWEQRA